MDNNLNLDFQPSEPKGLLSGRVDQNIIDKFLQEVVSLKTNKSEYLFHIVTNRHAAEQLMKDCQALKEQLEAEQSKSSTLNAQLKSESQKCNELTEQLKKSTNEIAALKKQSIELSQKRKESEHNHQEAHDELKRKNEKLENEIRELKKENVKQPN